jgi:hypothetical protein
MLVIRFFDQANGSVAPCHSSREQGCFNDHNKLPYGILIAALVTLEINVPSDSA